MSKFDLHQRAIAARREGRLRDAVHIYEQILALEPLNVRAQHELGSLLAHMGQLEAAMEHLREAHRLDPNAPEILNNLGSVLEQIGQAKEAIDCYRRAASMSPAKAIPHFNAGDLLRKTGQLDEAMLMLRAAATLDPELQEAWAALGDVHLARNEPAAALGSLRRALALRPTDDVSGRFLGDALQSLRRFADAITVYEQAIHHNPANRAAWYGLGRALLESDRPAEAVEALERCLTLDANCAQAVHDLGKALFLLGCIEKAMPQLQRAVTLGADDVRRKAMENLAIIVPGSPEHDQQSILDLRTAWGRTLPARPAAKSLSRRQPGRWRIGYVSSFFHRPNWMKPVWALINRHDRELFDLHLFSDAPANEVQGGYQRHPRDQVHDMTGLPNETIADQIAALNIDMLVDLNAYSAPERLGIYPLRPAPVIVGWFNWYATTGLDCFDYLIGDPSVIPEAEEKYYPERILRVPHSYLTFAVDYPVPEVAPLPMLQTGHATIGCLASQYKLTDQVVNVWSSILRRASQARLLIRNATLEHPRQQQHLRWRFETHGIKNERLLLEGRADHTEFLRTYDRIDFALDPFPYSGGTTTTEALWQGVPVITFDAGRWASRTSISILRAAGLEAYIGKDLDDYIAMSVRLATSPDAAAELAGFRGTARARLRQSPVCDAPAFARAVESLYQDILRSH